jgi:23S rRNA (cytosine1962-C5)-methyltransferase
MQVKSLKLVKGREESVLRRHPWIFSGAIQTPVDDISDGETVRILDHRGNVLGLGHFQNSSLAIRLLAFEDIVIDADFWKIRLNEAAKYRFNLGIYKQGYTEAFRLVHGEGDQLPGLIIDVYGNVAVVQAHSIGMHLARHLIADSLLKIDSLSIQTVYCKSHDALPATYADSVTDEWLTGEPLNEIIIAEGGIKFSIDVVTGQKTGFFLDQRENRDLLRRYSKDARILNCFSYSGGFTLYALDGFAVEATSVDTSAGALEILERNLSLNKIQGRHHSIKENVLTFLTNLDQEYDIVIIDPPAFAKNIGKRHNAIQAYKRLNMLAIARVKKGGMLFTFSCSQVVDRLMFHNTVVAAAIESGRRARIAHEMSQGPDHPVSIFHPEGHYLKGLALYID